MKIVIISKDQPKFIDAIEEKVSNFDHIFVIDRPTVEYRIPKNSIMNFAGEGFLAGRMRDMGASLFGNDDILFLDGDKAPIGEDLSFLDTLPYDCIVLPCENDRYRDEGYFKEEVGAIPNNNDYNTNFKNPFFTCGILYRKKLVEKLREINGGRIFNSVFDGNWGEEDRWNGDIINFLGFSAGYTTKIKLSGIVDGCDLENCIAAKNVTDRHVQYAINSMKRMNLRKKYFGDFCK